MAVELLGRLAEPAERCPHIPASSMSGVLVPAPYPNPFRRLWALGLGEPQQILLCAECLNTMREFHDRQLAGAPAAQPEVYARLGALGWPRADQRRFRRSLRRVR